MFLTLGDVCPTLVPRYITLCRTTFELELQRGNSQFDRPCERMKKSTSWFEQLRKRSSNDWERRHLELLLQTTTGRSSKLTLVSLASAGTFDALSCTQCRPQR